MPLNFIFLTTLNVLTFQNFKVWFSSMVNNNPFSSIKTPFKTEFKWPTNHPKWDNSNYSLIFSNQKTGILCLFVIKINKLYLRLKIIWLIFRKINFSLNKTVSLIALYITKSWFWVIMKNKFNSGISTSFEIFSSF